MRLRSVTSTDGCAAERDSSPRRLAHWDLGPPFPRRFAIVIPKEAEN
jgi:hypothetical protein